MVLLQLLMIGTWTIVETVYPGVAHEFDQILVAVIVLSQHDQVIAAEVFFSFLQVHVATTGHIHLTAEDRLERFQAFFLALLVHADADVMEFLNAEHVAVIRDGHALHAVGNGFVHKFLDARLSVENRVVGMYVQMYEIFHLLCCFFSF